MSNDLVLNLRIRANADGTAQVLGQTSDGIRRISTESGNASYSLRGMESAASGVARVMAPLVGIYETISFGHKVVDDTAAVQDLDTRLHSLTKTAGDYAKTVDYITTVSDAHHKKINDLSDGYAKLRNLQNAGIITEQQTKGMLEGLDNAASDLGASNEQLKQTFFGLAQGLSSGVLHAEELNQVTEPMPGLMQSLDRAAGLASGGFRRLTNDGKVTSQMFAETLVKALHDYDGAAAASAQNINAKSNDISNAWTRLVKSAEPITSALWTPIQDGAKDALDSIRGFNEAAITVGDTNVSASNLAKGAWDVTTQVIKTGWTTLEEAGLGAATHTVSGWIVSGDQMKSNVKFVVNDMIGLFVGLGHSVGIIAATAATNFNNMIDNVVARTGAAAGDVARMGVGDFSFSSSKAVIAKPMVNAWGDIVSQLKTDLSTDYVGTFTKAVEGAAVAYQNLSNEQQKATDAAEQAKAKTLQAAAAHKTVGAAVAEQSAEAKKAATAEKNRAEDVQKTIAALQNELAVNRLGDSEKTLQSELYNKLAKAKGAERDTITSLVTQIHAEANARKAQTEHDEKLLTSMDALTDKYKQLTLSARAYYEYTLTKGKIENGKLVPSTLTPGDIQPLMQQFDQTARVEANQKSVDTARSSLESYNKALADTIVKTSDLGATNTAIFDGALGGINTMTGAFDNMVKSLEANTKALDELHKKQVENAIFEKNAITDEARLRNNGQYLVDLKTVADNKRLYALEEQRLNNENLKNSLVGIRQIASATGTMFAENTSARKAFNIVSLAASVAERAADMAGLGVKAASAMLTQGQGDPYTAFARIAAMGAIVANILSAAGAGTFNFSGKAVSPGPQGLSPDTGTVLGDSSAKSQSIDKTYQLLKDIQAQNYPVLKSIDQGIADLHTGINDVITRLFQAGGLSAVNAPASQVTGLAKSINMFSPNMPLSVLGLDKIADPITNFLVSGIFGGKQTSTVIAQGIATAATSLMDVVAGKNLNAQQFAQIETKTDGGWFGKDKFSITTQYSALDAATQKALNDVFRSMGTTMFGLADNLGHGLQDRVNNYIIPALTVDLKGLDGEAAAKKLNGVLSTALDTMSTSVFGDLLGQYQQLGEGMLETAVRVVSEIAVVKDSLSKSGLSISGDAIAISDGLAKAAGGIKEFQKSFDAYYQKFYTEAERTAFSQKSLNSQLSDVNLILPQTREGYRQLVESLNINNAADQQRYSMLIKLSAAADTYYTGVESAAKAAQQIADQQRALDIQLMEASGNAIAALTAKRRDELAAMDESLRFTQQAIWATQAANTAIDKAKSDLNAAISAEVKNADTAVSNAVNNLSKSIGNLSSVLSKLRSALDATVVTTDDLTRQQRAGAQSTLDKALTIAKSGGSIDNLAGLDKALVDIAKPSENLYSSFVDYARDQGRAANTISQLADYASGQVSIAQQQLDAVNGTTSAVLSVKDAMANLVSAIDLRTATTSLAAELNVRYELNGNTAAVLSIKDAIQNLATALNVKAAITKAVEVAQEAERQATVAKIAADSAAARANQSAATLGDARSNAAKTAASASSAAAYADSLKNWSPAPSTWVNGQTNNPIWERVLSEFNQSHQARYGIPMNRPWGTDEGSVAAYQYLVGRYNALSAQAAEAAAANAAGLASLATAQAALIPGYEATAAADQSAASQAAAAYATAAAYAAAAKAAVPNINSFAVGTNYVPYDMTANIHEGERIIPKADNARLMAALEGRDNAELIAAINALQAAFDRQQALLAKIAAASNKTAELIDSATGGGGPMLVEMA